MYQLSHHARLRHRDRAPVARVHTARVPGIVAVARRGDRSNDRSACRRRLRAAAPNLDIAVGGRYTLTEKPNRLAFTWNWDGEAAVTQGIGLNSPVSALCWSTMVLAAPSPETAISKAGGTVWSTPTFSGAVSGTNKRRPRWGGFRHAFAPRSLVSVCAPA